MPSFMPGTRGSTAPSDPLVRGIVADFLAGHDPAREAGWIAEADGARIGCIFCVRKDDETAKLRLFLILPEARGR